MEEVIQRLKEFVIQERDAFRKEWEEKGFRVEHPPLSQSFIVDKVKKKIYLPKFINDKYFRRCTPKNK